MGKATFCKILVILFCKTIMHPVSSQIVNLTSSICLFPSNHVFLRSLGRVNLGHTVYISGLTCSMSKQNW